MHKIRALFLLLAPIPLLIGAVMVAAAFWQNDADFALNRVVSVDAVLVNSGPAHPARGMPRYYPTFRLLSDGRLLTVERAAVATELPPVDQPVQLLCSIRVPANCRMPTNPGIDRVFYAIGGLWSVFAVGSALALWRPRLRRVFGQGR